MKITKKWLVKHNACEEGMKWFLQHKFKSDEEDILRLIKEDKLDWANWTVSRLLNKDNKIKYGIYAAESLLHIFEEKYPDDKRPRQAIQAAKKYLKTKNKDNKMAAEAAWAAWAARDDAWAAWAAWAAAWAAWAARDDAWAAWDAGDARSAGDAAYTKIIKYGLKLYKKQSVKK